MTPKDKKELVEAMVQALDALSGAGINRIDADGFCVYKVGSSIIRIDIKVGG